MENTLFERAEISEEEGSFPLKEAILHITSSGHLLSVPSPLMLGREKASLMVLPDYKYVLFFTKDTQNEDDQRYITRSLYFS